MHLAKLHLQNFRSYSKADFSFKPGLTSIVGPNTSGKSNLLEAMYFLSTGKSFRADKDMQVIQFGHDMARLKGSVGSKDDNTELEAVITTGLVHNIKTPFKKYLVNGVSKRRVDFAGILPCILFSPLDLDIIGGSPGTRRRFLDVSIEQVDKPYRNYLSQYEKAIRQRNALLEDVQETGVRNKKLFEYWDNLLIEAGAYITQKREEFIGVINSSKKDVFDCIGEYDKSVISPERLAQYEDAEVGAGVTLVGPHRDDMIVYMPVKKTQQEIRYFGSRGQQRLAVLQLKLIQIAYIEEVRSEKPILLLDDIFSELDEGHIKLVLDKTQEGQVIITTTHKEFLESRLVDSAIIELGDPV